MTPEMSPPLIAAVVATYALGAAAAVATAAAAVGLMARLRAECEPAAVEEAAR